MINTTTIHCAKTIAYYAKWLAAAFAVACVINFLWLCSLTAAMMAYRHFIG